MYHFGKAVVRLRIPILLLSVLLLFPSVLGMQGTRINFDMLTYLPEDIETMRGQDILLEDFGKGAFSFIVAENMSDREISRLRQEIEQVDHVTSALWYDSFMSLSVPKEILPDKLRDVFINGDATMIAVFFDTSSSADETLDATVRIRELCGEHAFLSGISALVTDLKNLVEREEPIYVGIAVLCALGAMLLLLDSWLIPFLFLAGIGMTILYNLGTNWFLGEIAFITKALAAVLQLAVTMDYSIFLWHAYCAQKKETSDRNEAMARAVQDTVVSVAGSSLTTIAGFLALCFMTYRMGADLGIVMAKGCLLGVLGSVTILPSLILLLDKPLTKTMHRTLMPDLSFVSGWIPAHFPVFLLLFALLAGPAAIGYFRTPVYYDFTKVLSGESLGGEDMPFQTAKDKLQEYFSVATTHMALCSEDMPAKDAKAMMAEMETLPGVKNVLGYNTLAGGFVPEDFISPELKDTLKSGGWQLILINSEYAVSTDDVNSQIDGLSAILKRYDPEGMLIGEAPCTKDLIEITNTDFNVVSWVSIGFVFVIILLTLRSFSLPVILVIVIEFAVFINLGIPYYTNVTLPFIAPICISTIQLGSTVDYGILMTTHYKELRRDHGKKESVSQALAYSMPSVLVSALSFFASTIGVGLFSDIDLISSMCSLLSRGAIVSMFSVLLVLPSLLMLLDGLIIHTTPGLKPRKTQMTAREVSLHE